MILIEKSKLVAIPLVFKETKYKDTFKDKNNKTLKETLESKRYNSLKNETIENYSKYLDTPLGQFLLIL